MLVDRSMSRQPRGWLATFVSGAQVTCVSVLWPSATLERVWVPADENAGSWRIKANQCWRRSANSVRHSAARVYSRRPGCPPSRTAPPVSNLSLVSPRLFVLCAWLLFQPRDRKSRFRRNECARLWRVASCWSKAYWVGCPDGWGTSWLKRKPRMLVHLSGKNGTIFK